MNSVLAGAIVHEPLARRVHEGGTRVLALCAPGGYDKHAFLRTYGARVGTVLEADIDPRRDRDPARAILSAVISRDRSRTTRFAADRLAQRRGIRVSSAREALRREWPSTDGPELLVVRDAVGTLGSPEGVDLLTELLATLPAQRTLALATRSALPPALAEVVERQPNAVIGPAELALPPDVAQEAERLAAVPAERAHAVWRFTNGWPLVTRLLFALPEDEREAFLADYADAPREALLPLAAQRVLASIDPRVRDAVIAFAVHRGATTGSVMRVLGERCDDAVLYDVWKLPFVRREADGALVHPDVAGVLKARFAGEVQRVYERTLDVLDADGAYAAASRAALDYRDAERAIALLDRAEPYSARAPGLTDYEQVIDRVDHELLIRYPNVWLATIAFRRFAIERDAYIREAETVYYCLPHSASMHQRSIALMHLASAYFNVGRTAECYALVEPALATWDCEPKVRASLLNFVASLRGEEGRFEVARSLAREAAHAARQEFTEAMTLHHVDAQEAYARGQHARAERIYDELLRRQSRDEQPLYYAYAATDAAICAWTYGDDAAFMRYIGLLEDALTPGLEPGFARMLDAARGRDITSDDAYAWPVHVAISELYRMANASTTADAVKAAYAAARAADQRDDPVTRVCAHVALYVLEPAARSASAATMAEVAARVDSPELRAAVDDVLRGRGYGILEPFVRRRVTRERGERATALSVELVAGRVLRDGSPVKLSSKELELVALLASSYGPLSRDRIGEALWEHLEPEEWSNNLKVTVSRVRAKLGSRDALITADGQYRLSRSVDVDLRRYESVVRETGERALDEQSRSTLAAILAAYGEGDASRYERFSWMQPVVARLTDVVCTAGIALARDAMRRHDEAEAIRYARIVIDIDPYSEAACEIVMRASIARGDADAARREYRRYAGALGEGLDARPAQHLTELVRAIG